MNAIRISFLFNLKDLRIDRDYKSQFLKFIIGVFTYAIETIFSSTFLSNLILKIIKSEMIVVDNNQIVRIINKS